MNREGNSKNRRITLVFISILLLAISIACKLPSIFNPVGNLGDTIEKMFENIGRGFGL